MENLNVKTEERFVNLCPHDVDVVQYGVKQKVRPSGVIARVSSTIKEVGYFAGVRLVEEIYGEINGLPEPEPGVMFIVSGRIKDAVEKSGDPRCDLATPAECERNAEGQIAYAKSFSVIRRS